jgi:hypothetical protein
VGSIDRRKVGELLFRRRVGLCELPRERVLHIPACLARTCVRTQDMHVVGVEAEAFDQEVDEGAHLR